MAQVLSDGAPAPGSVEARVIDYVAADFLKQHGIDLRKNDLALKRLTDAAQKAGNDLLTKDTVEVNLPFIAANAKGPLHIMKLRVTRDALG